MKKLLSFILALTLLAGCYGGAKQSTAAKSSSQAAAEASALTQPAAEASQPVRIAALKGPTAMGMVKLMQENHKNNQYSFAIEGAIDAVTPKLIKGEVDIAAVPANVASVLYNKTKGQIKVLAINTLGVLYIAENGNAVNSIEDLKGKTIYSAGKGATPEYALNYALSCNGLDPEKDVAIEYKSEHAECVAMLENNPDAVALLPQPFLTTATMKKDSIRMAIDLNEAYSQKSGAALITGVVVARADFAEAHPDKINAFLEEYKESADYAISNTEGAAKLVGEFGIIPEAVAKKALPYCGIAFISGDEMQQKLSSYLSILFEQNPKAIGGALPDDGFYYKKQQ